MRERPENISWDDRFDRADYLYGKEPAGFVTAQGPRIPAGSRVLSVADGEGRNSVWLAGRGLIVTAMEFSRNAQDKARALAAERGVAVDFRLGDILAWDWAAEPYDALVGAYFQFLSPDQRAQVFKGFDQALRPGGMLLLHGFAPRQVDYGTGGPPIRENMYTPDLLRAAFPEYEVVFEADYDTEIHSGAGHNGMAALVDFVAVKPG